MASALLQQVRPSTVAGTVLAGAIGVGIASRFFVPNVQLDSGAPKMTFGGGPAFFSLALESSEHVNHNTKRLRFKLPEADAVSGLSMTSALLTMSWPKDRWTPVLRPYTPVSSLDAPGHLDLLVKRYPNGKSSTHLHSLAPGDRLFFVAAIKGYQWQPNSYRHIILIAGGAGITPIHQLAQGILSNPDDKTAMTLVFGVNGDQDVLLRKEFQEFEKAYPDRFKAIYTVSNPGEGSPFREGYVTKQLLEEVAPSPKGVDTKVFLCGPPAMETALIGSRSQPGILQQLGYDKSQIHRF